MSQLHVMVLDPGMKSTALLLNFVYNQVQETWRQLIRNRFFCRFLNHCSLLSDSQKSA